MLSTRPCDRYLSCNLENGPALKTVAHAAGVGGRTPPFETLFLKYSLQTVQVQYVLLFQNSCDRQSWSLGQNLRDRDETLTPRNRDLEQKVETRLERSEIETRHETFGIRGSQKVVNILTVNSPI